MEIGIIVIGVVAVAIIFLFFYFVPVGLWLTAVFSGVRVSIATLVGMRLRKVSPPDIVRPLISATKAGMTLSVAEMEAHYLAGGNVGRVVTALISADRAHIELPWMRAAAIDLAGRDMLEAVQADSPMEREGMDMRLSRQSGETGSDAKQGAPEGLLWVHRDPDLGPHGRELFYFGHRLRDRIFLASPERLLVPAMGTGGVNFDQAADRRSMEHPADMWIGRGWGRASVGKPAEPGEERVEREWGLVLYNARVHSLYDSFRQHLQGHPCLTLLDVVERQRTAYLKEVQMWWADEGGLRSAYEDVKRAIREFQVSLSPDARLRKSILEGRCELCPLAGPGVPEGTPVVISYVPAERQR